MHGGEILFVALVCWAIGLVTFIVMRGLGWKHREKQIEARMAEQQALPRQPGPTLDQVQMLEDRMRVLEKIVTDRGYTLADDIEALRDRTREEKKETL
ncbi:MAG TPA: hypothetical protein VIC34_12510 [Croceibacterium sp.]|jgi:hypothetical protein